MMKDHGRYRAVCSLMLVALAIGFVTFGHQSDAAARNNSSRWDEECYAEGCDNEEREEMYDLGSFAEEAGVDWYTNNEKAKFQATFEITELAAPPNTSIGSWGFCKLMIDDFQALGKTNSALSPIELDCNRRWNNFTRPK
jgi:hypothetical protein